MTCVLLGMWQPSLLGKLVTTGTRLNLIIMLLTSATSDSPEGCCETMARVSDVMLRSSGDEG